MNLNRNEHVAYPENEFVMEIDRVVEGRFAKRPSISTRQLTVNRPTIPTDVAWYLSDLGVSLGKQKLFTAQAVPGSKR